MAVLLHPVSFPNIATLAILIQKEVIWEVYDNYQKQTFRNRYHICTDQGLHKLIVPIRHLGTTNGRQFYRDVRIDNSYSWQKQHWRTLETAYRTSPFFEYFEDELAPIFKRPFTFLMDFNWESLAFLYVAIDRAPEIVKTTAYTTEFEHGYDGRFLVNAKESFDFNPEPYVQVFTERHGFIGNMSTLDLLFNEGGNSAAYLRKLSLDFLK
ncbi:MAG: WbqC family protein [Bacteroidota bacterium]